MPSLKKSLVIFSFLLYLISCFSAAYNGVQSDSSFSGILCLGFGWMALIWNLNGFFAWLANFPYFINVVMVLFSKRTWSRLMTTILAVVSFCLSIGAFDVTEIVRDEGGHSEPASYGAGLYLWVLSMFVLLIAAALPGEKKQVEINYINNPNAVK